MQTHTNVVGVFMYMYTYARCGLIQLQPYLAVELGAGSDPIPTKGQNFTIYKEYFEDEFLKDTERYYLAESGAFLEHNSVTEYMKKVRS